MIDSWKSQHDCWWLILKTNPKIDFLMMILSLWRLGTLPTIEHFHCRRRKYLSESAVENHHISSLFVMNISSHIKHFVFEFYWHYHELRNSFDCDALHQTLHNLPRMMTNDENDLASFWSFNIPIYIYFLPFPLCVFFITKVGICGWEEEEWKDFSKSLHWTIMLCVGVTITHSRCSRKTAHNE